jgi:hypothetical protein
LKCPLCKAWADVLETRGRPHNETHRRYECANHHRFSTKENVVDGDKTTEIPDKIRNLLWAVPGGLTVAQISQAIGVTVGYVRKTLVKMNDVYVLAWIGVIPMPAWSVAARGKAKPDDVPRPPKSEETLRKLKYKEKAR